MPPTTSTAAEEAAAALKASMSINAAQVALTEESRLMLKAMLRDEMRVAVAEGVRAAMTQEAAVEFWATGLDVLQKQAAQAAGGWVMTGLGALFRKVALFALLGGLVYALGGWSALVGFAKLLAAGGQK